MVVDHTPTSPTAAGTTYGMSLTSGGLPAAATFSGFSAALTGVAGDGAGSILAAFHASSFASGGGSAAGAGFLADASYTYGLASFAPVYVSANSANNAVEVEQNGSGKLAIFRDATAATTRLETTVDGKTSLESDSALGSAVLSIQQNDADEPFIDYSGTSSATYNDNVSTLVGDGAVDGPKNKNLNPGWTFANLMIRVNVNGTDYWMPLYSPAP